MVLDTSVFSKIVANMLNVHCVVFNLCNHCSSSEKNNDYCTKVELLPHLNLTTICYLDNPFIWLVLLKTWSRIFSKILMENFI